MNKKAIAVTVTACTLVIALVYSAYFISISRNGRTAAVNGCKTLIIIDAGHGGADGGAVGTNGAVEKDINLSIALMLNEELSSRGYATLMTRTEDISLHDEDAQSIKAQKTSDLHNRMKLMEESGDCIFVSIHQNSYTSQSSNGTQVFYSPKTRDKSLLLAQCIQETVITELQPDNKRLVKESGSSIYLLYNAVKPAVMVECGFLTNPTECDRLCDTVYKQQLACSIASGIDEYLNTIGQDG